MLMRTTPLALVLALAGATQAEDVTIVVGTTKTFTATVLDQFGNPMATQPSVSWDASVGSLSATTGATTDLTAPAAPASGDITASSGALSATRTIGVVEQLPGIDFRTATFINYDNSQDGGGTVAVSPDGTTVTISGNAWKAMALPTDIAADTVLSFEFRSTHEGEIQGIGMDVQVSKIQSSKIFQLFGTQNWGIQNYNTYASGDGWIRYDIPIGTYYTGQHDYLVFANDDDGSKDGISEYRNVLISDGTPPPPPVDNDPVASIDPVSPVTDTDDNGSETITVTQASTDDNGIASYDWQIGGTTVGTTASLTYAFPVGDTTLTLIVTDTVGQTDSTSTIVTVNPAPIIDNDPVAVINPVSPVTDTDDNGSETITVTQASTDDNGIASYDWQISGATVGTTASLTYDFPVGDTTLTLIVTDTIGQTDSASTTVTVEPAPIDNNPIDNNPIAIIDPVNPVTDTDDNGTETITVTQASTDDKGIASYDWQISGATVGTTASLTYDFPVGDTALTLIVTDTIGQTNSASITVTVDPAPPITDPGTIDFRTTPVLSFGGNQDAGGTASVSTDGTTITFAGNTWKAVALPTTVTADTVLSFEFRSTHQGEIHSIGLGNNLNDFRADTFQLYGTQSWSNTTYKTYTPDGWIRFDIPIGTYQTGTFDYLLFINDDDGSKDGIGEFRHVSISTGATPPPIDNDPLAAIDAPAPVEDTDGSGSETMTITQSSTDDNGIASYDWQIAGSTVGTGASLTYDFPVGGTDLTLTVTDTIGQTASDTTTVTVTAPPPPVDNNPVASIDGHGPVEDTDDDGVETITVTQSSTDDNGIASYDWQIAGSTVGTAASLTYAFPVGDTVVTLNVTDTVGQTASDSTTITVTAAPPPPPPGDIINFNDHTVIGFGGNQDAGGTATIEDGGATLALAGNTWKAIALPYTVTPDTVVSFEFKSTTEGEVHGIGFDTDMGISSNYAFKVHGTQGWGRSDYNTYTPDGWQLYEIPVGQFYTGAFQYLFFMNDHDSGAKNADSRYRNIQISEVPNGNG